MAPLTIARSPATTVPGRDFGHLGTLPISSDHDKAASYAIQLNKSRKEFETKLQMLKLRKGTLATQLAAARSGGGDAFGNDPSVWERFKLAEDRIDSEAIQTEARTRNCNSASSGL